MRLILATNHLGLGGSESYLLTVAEQLDRLGHEVVLYTREPGEGAQVARERGLTVHEGGDMPGECDAALVQDPGVSFEVAARLPGAPQVFVAHSESFDVQAPPQLDGAVQVVVALNDRVADRLRAFEVQREIVRLRQPIDVERFLPLAPLNDPPRRALLFSNTPISERLGMLESACESAGLALTRIGGEAGTKTDVRPALAGSDIVIGYGRSALEAMACARAAYVYDWHGGDGWVTADSYPTLEADGFAGRGETITTEAKLREDLERYDRAMGSVNRDLIVGRHRANVHAQELVEIFRRLVPGERPPRAPLAEMARLVRLEWRARVDAVSFVSENNRLRGELANCETRLAESTREARDADARRNRELGEQAQEYERALSWRVTRPLRAAGRLARRLRGDISERPAADPAAEPPASAELSAPEPESPPHLDWEGLSAEADRHGADLVPRNWMSPIPTEPDRDLWSEPRQTVVDLRVEEALLHAESDLAGLAEGLGEGIAAAGLESRFRLWNDSYQGADAELLYAMTRFHRPGRVIELGSGYSTMVLRAALDQNRLGGGPEAPLVSYDPSPVEAFGDGVEGVEFERLPAGDVPIERFTELGAGDLLFIDTTHTVKLGGEVNYLVLDVLPRLNPGVLVHFHDIFLPYEYPRQWFERGMFFAEQYLLEAFLAGNDSYEVIFPAQAVARHDRERLAKVLPSLAEPRSAEWIGPAAFWMRRRG